MPEYSSIPIESINEPPIAMRVQMDDQAMSDLEDSMRTLGQTQPVIVVRRDSRFEVVDGHRRYRAAREMGWETLQALVYDTEGLALEAIKVHSNLLREDVNAADEAVYYREVLEKYNLDEAGLCALVKRSPDYIGDRMRLLRGDPDVFEAVLHRQLSFAAARELNKFQKEEMRKYFLHQAVASGCSSRIVRQWIDDDKRLGLPTPTAEYDPPGAAPPEAYIAQRMECTICGGYRDPYNLVPVFIHRHCKDQVDAAVKKAERES